MTPQNISYILTLIDDYCSKMIITISSIIFFPFYFSLNNFRTFLELRTIVYMSGVSVNFKQCKGIPYIHMNMHIMTICGSHSIIVFTWDFFFVHHKLFCILLAFFMYASNNLSVKLNFLIRTFIAFMFGSYNLQFLSNKVSIVDGP